MQDGHPGGDVAQRHREVEVAVGLLHGGEPVAQPQPVVIDEADLLRRVLWAGVEQQRAQPDVSACSDTRAARLAERVEENVAIASTSVPPAVASEAIVLVSATSRQASALDAHEPRKAGEAQDARDVQVQPQPEDVVRGVDAQELLADARERVARDVQREQARRA